MRRIISVASRPTSLAVIERVINRGASAAVGVVMLFFVTPAQMGIYAGAVLVYSLCQSLGEIAIRQCGPVLWRITHGPQLVFRSSRVAGILTGCAIVGYAIAIYGAGVSSLQDAVCVAALSVAALSGSLAQPRLTYAQATGAWSVIASRQVIASCCSVVGGLCLVPFLGIGGGVAQTVVAETVFLLTLPRSGRQLPMSDPSLFSSRPPVRQLLSMSTSNLLGWLQVQSERITIALAGAGILGTYSTGFQLARSMGDPVANGLVSVLRNELVGVRDQGQVISRALVRAGILGSLLQSATFVLLVLPLSILLPPRWDDALFAATLLGIGVGMTICTWMASTLITIRDELRRLLPWQVLGIALALLAGLLTGVSLWLGLVALLVRDAIAFGIRLRLIGDALDRRSVSHLALCVVASVLLGSAGLAVLAQIG